MWTLFKKARSPKSVTIRVTNNHINPPYTDDSVTDCMVARAMLSAGFTDVNVGFNRAECMFGGRYYNVVFPVGVATKIQNWVCNTRVEPFSFELPLA